MNYTRKRALLACDFCRHRKRKCDGKKPCFTCRDSNADCVYQELPSDRIEESGPAAVIDRLSRIEAILEQQSQQIYQLNIRPSQSPNPSPHPTSQSDHLSERQSDFFIRLPGDPDTSLESSSFLIPKNHGALATTLLALPQVRDIIGEYPRDYFFQVEEQLPLPGILDRIHDGPLTWPLLDPGTMDILAASYFQHVHPHQPLFTPRTFRSWQTRLLDHDLDGITTSICLCVYALGAMSSTQGGHQKAPETLGLEYFQPALKMIVRDVLWEFRSSISMCQALLLASSYFAHLGRPLHSLRMGHFASQLFLNISERRNNLTHVEFDDEEVRVYWQCFMVECDGVAEIDASRSGIEPLGDMMPLPQSLESSDDRNHIYAIAEHAIRRLLNRILSALYNPDSTHRYSLIPPDPVRIWQRMGLPKLVSLSAELNRQLEQWYRSIPEYLRFTKGTDPLPNDRSRVLRIRYYMARHLIHRPFLLQAVARQQDSRSSPLSPLPESDPFNLPVPIALEKCEICIDSCVNYLENVICMIDKRSPYLWTFAQNCMATLIVLWLADNSARLSHLVPAMQPIQNVILDRLRQWAVENSSFDSEVRIIENLIFSDRG
ncbi:hypothetical protein F5B22DRAFT_57517 [Xylaria bambusicola]|uniref:uncharacterized protein n=1 Tax=Xylaria bambusicola TaxID=326684 RepID=UPI0020075F0C|nr:uncharacterized protein F5B22DRAFT_57517 [Xylaria bambusicola]KAI0520937.1 hypothetical protein F5B22DRAFT_57517 [Xylaria bambusicola]